jgi:hypothetical protein
MSYLSRLSASLLLFDFGSKYGFSVVNDETGKYKIPILCRPTGEGAHTSSVALNFTLVVPTYGCGCVGVNMMYHHRVNVK